MRTTRLLPCAAGAALLASPALVLADGPTLDERLERLVERLEDQRIEMNIPGMAIAVVKDDQVILARGFGVRDVENELPADEHTMFAVGSSTKAFTATLIGMLIDEGRMDWDDPIVKHLPEFRLHDDEASKQATLRDALCHRSGLNRTDLLWASGNASRGEIIQAVANAELYSPFREKWHYNNIMYLAAGEASARTAGKDWDTLLAERLLQPLGMGDSNSTYEDAQAHPALANGYRWDKERETYTRLPMRSINSVAPAGSINSTATDMAQWVRFQLGRGEIDGTRLISQELVEETWTKCKEVTPGMDYGLGWFVRTWQGKRLIEHGGNIDGFACTVALLPDENVGYALMMNVSHSPLQQASIGIVFDALLGDPDAEPGEPIDFRPYLGKYHFAPMEADFTVLERDGKLAVDVPGQMVYELKPPDDEGRWEFAITDTIAVSFVRDEDDRVIAMNMYQAGLTFELPREGVAHELEVDMDEVGPLLGTYRAVEGPGTERDLEVRVLIQHGRLAVDVPGQMIYELHLPDDDGRWVFRATDDIHVTFEEDDDNIPVLMMHQAGMVTRLIRTGGDDSDQVPSVDELIALVQSGHNAAAMDNIRSLRVRETVRMVHQGITGTSTITVIAPDRVRHDMDLGEFGYIHSAISGDAAWRSSDIVPDEPDVDSETRDELRTHNPLALFTDWRETFDDIAVQPNETREDRLLHVVRLTSGTVRRTVRIDAETGVIVSEDLSMLMPGIGRLTQRVRYEEHREVNGLKLPSRTVIENDLLGRMISTMDEAEVNVDVPEDHFAAPST